MSVDVAIGDAHLVLPSGLYSYWGWTDAVTNVSITAASASNPRIDVIVAYVDPAVTTGTNNVNAFKIRSIAGTAAASPTAPSSSTIQSTLGAGVPWVLLAQVSVATSASTIVNANISDKRSPIALKTRLYGGASNTNGHTVPNVADDTVALLNAAQAFTNKTFANNSILANNLATNAIKLGKASIASTFSSAASATWQQVTGLSLSITIPAGGRDVELEVFGRDIFKSGGGVLDLGIWDGSVGTGNLIATAEPNLNSGQAAVAYCKAYLDAPAAGSKTYNVGINPGSAASASLEASSSAPAIFTAKVV